MNTTISTTCCLFLFAGTLVAPAFAQEKPPAAEAPKQPATTVIVSSQGKEKVAVDISLSLRHAPSADAKCAKEAWCSNAEHWLVDMDVTWHKVEGKPVALAMSQLAEIEKQLGAAVAPKARRVEGATISESTVSIRAPEHAPYGLVQQLVATAAKSGIHRIEFTAPSTAAVEQTLPLPIQVGDKTTVQVDFVEADTKAMVRGVRISVLMDKAKGQPVRQFGMNVLPTGAEGDAKLQALVRAAAKDLASQGIENAPAVIDAAELVPWQAIVEVVDAIRSAGVKDVHFAAGVAKK